MSAFSKISIIIPTFNCETTIDACLQSVINQTYKYKEIVVIDGQSQDRTIEILKNYHDDIIYISEPDEGIYDAMNKGIEFATGDWLYFMGSDDVFADSDVLHNIFSKEVRIGKYDVVYGNVLFKHSGKCYDGKFSSFKLLHKNICHQAIFVKRIVFEKLGYFDLKYKMLADWCFNMHWFNSRVIKHKFVNIVIAIYNEDGSSFNIDDEQFHKDRTFIEKANFPQGTLFLYRNRNRRGIRQIIHFLFNYN